MSGYSCGDPLSTRTVLVLLADEQSADGWFCRKIRSGSKFSMSGTSGFPSEKRKKYIDILKFQYFN